MGYPAYRPPHFKPDEELTKRQIQENFEYFLATKEARTRDFWLWLEKNFPDEKRPDRLDWLVGFTESYSQVIAPSFWDDQPFVYETYDAPWEGPHAWASLTFDIATVAGDLVLERCPGGHWATKWDLSIVPNYKDLDDPQRIDMIESIAREAPVYGRPLVVWPGDLKRLFFDPHYFMSGRLSREAGWGTWHKAIERRRHRVRFQAVSILAHRVQRTLTGEM